MSRTFYLKHGVEDVFTAAQTVRDVLVRQRVISSSMSGVTPAYVPPWPTVYAVFQDTGWGAVLNDGNGRNIDRVYAYAEQDTGLGVKLHINDLPEKAAEKVYAAIERSLGIEAHPRFDPATAERYREAFQRAHARIRF